MAFQNVSQLSPFGVMAMAGARQNRVVKKAIW